MSISKIINLNSHYRVLTHSGVFHADEIVARELLKLAGVRITDTQRTRDNITITTALDEINIIVLDCGGKYDPDKLNFDHHQNDEITFGKATAGLIYDFVKYDLFPNDPIAAERFGKVIDAIDCIDINFNNIKNQLDKMLPEGFRHMSQIIGSFNCDDINSSLQDAQFEAAAHFTYQWLKNEIRAAKNYSKMVTEYNEREIVGNNVAVFPTFHSAWREFGDHIVAIMPCPEGWQMVVADSNVQQVPTKEQCLTVIPERCFIFRHNAGFILKVKTKEAAIAVAGLV